MNLFDSLVSYKFKRIGRTWLYHPWGSWGRGYIIADQAQYEKIWRFESLACLGGAAIFGSLAVLEVGSFLFLLLMVPGLLIYVYQVGSLTKNLPVEPVHARIKREAGEDPIVILVLIEVLWIFLTFFLLSVYLASPDMWLVLVVAILTGFLAAVYAYKIYLKINNG